MSEPSRALYSVSLQLIDQPERVLIRPTFSSLYDAQSFVNASFNVGVFLANANSAIGGEPLLSHIAGIGIPTSRVKRVAITMAGG